MGRSTGAGGGGGQVLEVEEDRCWRLRRTDAGGDGGRERGPLAVLNEIGRLNMWMREG